MTQSSCTRACARTSHEAVTCADLDRRSRGGTRGSNKSWAAAPRRSTGSTPRAGRRRASGSRTLLDPGSASSRLGLWAAYEMYEEWGGAPGAGVVTVIGSVAGRRVMVVANDATVKAGACFPMTIKKILRAQTIAGQNRLPLVYLVDSSGVFLPMQDEVFPDEDDFGRIFRNNAVLSAAGIPQYAAIMGNCVAGGAYLPVLCDTVLMTEGSGLYLAGPALVKAAIGQEISHEELGRRSRARGHQRHGRLPRARRRRLPGPAAPAGRVAAARPSGAGEPSHDRAAGPAGRRHLTPRELRPVGAVRRARSAGGDPGRRPARRISHRVWPDAGLRIRPAGRERRWASWRTSGSGSGPRGAGRSSSAA